MIGRIIGNYEVISQFGEGGMGELYLGRHSRLAREVIIKTIRTEDFSPRQIENLRDRLEREAFIQSQLDHPHIVRVYDFIAEGDTTCMVMEYVPGRDLRKMIMRETGPIPAARAIHIFKQVLAAIDYAHNFTYADPSGQKHRGIIHRDLKPANILVTPDDQIKVTDFGIVKLKGVRGGTQLGFNPGTPEYMSPEQALGREIDQRSDIYSLGIVFYEMLTGRVPFEDTGSGTSDYAIRKGHIEMPVPPPSQFYPAIAPQLEAILLRSLEKNPETRFQTAREFLIAIEEFERAGVASGALRAAPLPRQTVIQRDRGTGRPASVGTAGAEVVDPTHRRTQVGAVNHTGPAVVGPQTGPRSLGDGESPTRSRVPLIALAVIALLGASGLIYYVTLPDPKPRVDDPTPTPIPTGMIRIAAGQFEMGRADGNEYEKPVHRVEVKSFAIDETEVTNDEYQQFIDSTRRQPPSHWKNGRYAAGTANLPVVEVTWYDAQSYCQSLGKRLPLEEEWEYAARGTEGRLYPYGNEWKPRFSNAAEDRFGAPRPVRSYPEGKSPWGVYDMAGNVLEWTSSDFKPYPNSRIGPDDPNSGRKVLRGGAFIAEAKYQTATDRFFYPPTAKSEFIGFRCAKDSN